MTKDWTGNKKSTFATLGASNHSDGEREEHDYYATEPRAAELLLELEPELNNIWECSCVDSDTEFFNGTIWKKISEYEEGDLVLQYESTGIANLTAPLKYHKKLAKKMFQYKNMYLDMCLSVDHRVVFKHRRSGNLHETSFESVIKSYLSDSNGFRGKIPTGFNFSGNLVLNEWELRLAVACNADGRIKSGTNFYEVRVKKNRKKDRMILLLNKAKISYKYFFKNEYHHFYFYSPLGCKIFPIEWINLTLELKRSFLNEARYWDGHISENGSEFYFSSKKKDADFVQLLIHSIGLSTNFDVDIRAERPNTKPSYRISILNKNTCAMSKNRNTALVPVTSTDGNMYCFTVSSGMLVLRRKNKIFITGNCGGGHLADVFQKAGKLGSATDLIDRGYGHGGYDFLAQDWNWDGDIVTNPPYKYAREFIEKALDSVENGRKVCMFLKLTFLEGKGRKQLFTDTPPKIVYVTSSRLNCAKNGDFKTYGTNSAAAYAWFIWEKGYRGDTILKWFN